MQRWCMFKGLFGKPNKFATNKHDFDVRFRQTLCQFFLEIAACS